MVQGWVGSARQFIGRASVRETLVASGRDFRVRRPPYRLRDMRGVTGDALSYKFYSIVAIINIFSLPTLCDD
jgi:hypothetical protein